MKRLVVVLSALLLTSCAAAMINLTPDGGHVRTGKNDPGPGEVEIGPVAGSQGGGCGGFGTIGTYKGAYNDLRNKAARMGANYVRIDLVQPPHAGGGCAVDKYLLNGVAFKRGPGAPAKPAASPTVTPKMGTERAPCYPNHTCNTGLTCASDLCVRLPASASTASAPAH